MRFLVTFLFLLKAFSVTAQVSQPCKAFTEGCWTLIGASNGVEVYVTHNKTTRPGQTTGFNITVYGKIVNTNDYPMTTSTAATTPFYFKPAATNLLTFKEIQLDKDLGPRQTIVRYEEVFTNLNEIIYSQIKSFIYVKKP